MIKVVHLITRLDLGGAQGNTLYTASHLDPARFDVLLGSGEGGPLDAEARVLAEDARRPFRLSFLPDLVREVSPFRDLSTLFHIAVWLKDENPRIVHTHSSKAGILGRLAAWLAGVPVIVHTYHGFGFHEHQSAVARGLFILLERICRCATTAAVFVSKANHAAAARLGLQGPRDVLIRSGVPLGELPAQVEDKAAKKASLGCRMHKPLVVSVGNLKQQKNPQGFLRVAEQVLKEVPECSFVFIGDGDPRVKAALEARVLSRGLQGRVLFPGWRRDVPEILAAADLFLLTSLWEGLPRSLVEAMKTGLPCVCYGVDGISDVVKDGENGILATPGDEEGAARQVVRLLKDKDLARKLGLAAASAIGTEFDIDEMVRRQEELYDSLLVGAR